MVASTFPASSPMPLSKAWIWTGRIFSGFIVAFLLFDAVVKLMRIQPVIDSFAELGYPDKFAVPIGIMELVIIALYAIPRTAVFGALFLTALLGGAIATHVRVDSPLFSTTLFGVYTGLIAWAGLYLREPRLRALVPLRS
ncbi:MAG TPA: DoxX family protein [Steroidobacteraceae bacterium]|nr:DoxX family protein [Steroidobacteraceae bacterium]